MQIETMSNLPPTTDLLAAAFSSLLKTPVITQTEFDALRQKNAEAAKDAQILNLGHLYKHTYKWAPLGGGVGASVAGGGGGGGQRIQVFVKTLTGNTREVFISTASKIFELKEEIQKCLHWPPEQQRLIFEDEQLSDDNLVSDYGIGNHATLHIVMMRPTGENSLYYLDGSLLAPNYDYDFTSVNDSNTKFYRGDFVYTRPCGWQRKAMKVVGEYGDNVWLGGGGIRTDTTPGEWPVSYHSTAACSGRNIAQDGSLQSQGLGATYDRGIFTTPQATTAAKYAPTFTFAGQKYQVIFQNRVNPKSLQQMPSTASGEFWASPKEEDVRPYNICLRRVSS